MNKQTFLKYLVECLLIFISVIAAFLFDNERERRQFRDEELSLLRDVTTDLVSDTMQYRSRIMQARDLRNDLTELIRSLESPQKSDSVKMAFKPFEVVLNKTTYDVIKSTGGFKFILDKELVKGLSDYYNSREYITGIYSKLISDTDERIMEILLTKTKFTDNPNPYASYLVFTHTINPQSLNMLKGNQELINLCYMKRTLLDQLISTFENFTMVKGKELYIKCSKYLDIRN